MYKSLGRVLWSSREQCNVALLQSGAKQGDCFAYIMQDTDNSYSIRLLFQSALKEKINKVPYHMGHSLQLICGRLAERVRHLLECSKPVWGQEV